MDIWCASQIKPDFESYGTRQEAVSTCPSSPRAAGLHQASQHLHVTHDVAPWQLVVQCGGGGGSSCCSCWWGEAHAALVPHPNWSMTQWPSLASEHLRGLPPGTLEVWPLPGRSLSTPHSGPACPAPPVSSAQGMLTALRGRSGPWAGQCAPCRFRGCAVLASVVVHVLHIAEEIPFREGRQGRALDSGPVQARVQGLHMRNTGTQLVSAA